MSLKETEEGGRKTSAMFISLFCSFLLFCSVTCLHLICFLSLGLSQLDELMLESNIQNGELKQGFSHCRLIISNNSLRC